MTTTPPSAAGNQLFAYLAFASVDSGSGSTRGFAVGATPAGWSLLGSSGTSTFGALGSVTSQVVVWTKVGTGSDTFSIPVTGTSAAGTCGAVCGSFAMSGSGTTTSLPGARGRASSLSATPAYTASIASPSSAAVVETFYWSSTSVPISAPVIDATDTSGFTATHGATGAGYVTYSVAEHDFAAADPVAPMPQWKLTALGVALYVAIVIEMATVTPTVGGIRFGYTGIGDIGGLG